MQEFLGVNEVDEKADAACLWYYVNICEVYSPGVLVRMFNWAVAVKIDAEVHCRSKLPMLAFLPFSFLGKKKKGGKKLQLGLHGGSDFPFLRVAQKHTAYFLFGLAAGSRATAAARSEPITLRKNEAGVRKSAKHRGREWTLCYFKKKQNRKQI